MSNLGIALVLVVWAFLLLMAWALCRMAAMSDRRAARLHHSPRAKGAGDAPPAPLAPARIREVVTGDERELLMLIDSERNRP